MALSHSELRRQLLYRPRTGQLIWVIRKSRIHPGMIAGSKHSKGNYITLNGKQYRTGRLIWFWMKGKWPPKNKLVDHRNRNSHDDRWNNLRLANRYQNQMNSNGFGPLRGICKIVNSYRVHIDFKRKRYLYHVSSLKKAKALRRKLERKFYGEFAVRGR